MMIKVKNYDNFEAFEMDEASQDYEMVAVVGKNGSVCADMMTECKSYKTAIRRFFKALENDSRFDGWQEVIKESCDCGYFSGREEYYEGDKLVYTGGWFWGVEQHEGVWYIYVNVVDETKQELADDAGSSEKIETVSCTATSVTSTSESTTSTANTVDTVSNTMLTAEEIEYFNGVVAKVKHIINMKLPIYHMDHEKMDRKYREALGICWAKAGRNGERVPTKITIDDWFIHENFIAQTDPLAVFLPETLEYVIAHEIAHLRYWRHGKKHTEWTEHIHSLILRGAPNGMPQEV